MIAVVADWNPANPTHVATSRALEHAGGSFEWVPTEECIDAAARLEDYAGVLIGPASPYRSLEGALEAIRFGREHGVPLVGTWGGFQHVAVEVARNVLGFEDADHAEATPGAATLVITPLSCPLAGQEQPVFPAPGTRAAELYGREVTMPYRCSYGLDREWEARLAGAGLRVTARGPDGEARMFELDTHPFLVGTLFIPQMRSSPGKPDPLVRAFVEAAR